MCPAIPVDHLLALKEAERPGAIMQKFIRTLPRSAGIADKCYYGNS